MVSEGDVEKAEEGLACAECGKVDDAELMLCDGGCNRGFHLHCLQPPLESVPEGKWSCEACTQRLYSSEAGSREVARALHASNVRIARNLRRGPLPVPSLAAE